MKIMIASDLHGSAFYTAKLLDRYAAEGAERLILLGDVLYHGPRNDLPKGYAPKEVVAMLNPLRSRITCVRGNCDAEVDQMVLEFPILTEHLVTDLSGVRVLLTHGHHVNPDAPASPALLDGARYVLFGHTHVPEHTERDGICYLNPGSVSIPKAGSRHGYLMLEEDAFVWRDLDGEQTDRLPLKR